MFACRLDECPPGLFLKDGCLGLKTEYRSANDATEAFVVASGESFVGGATSYDEREALMVVPVEIVDGSALRLVALDREERAPSAERG